MSSSTTEGLTCLTPSVSTRTSSRPSRRAACWVMSGAEVRDEHGDPVDDGRAGHLGGVPQLGRDPLAGQAEHGLVHGGAGQRVEVVAEREHAAGGRLAAADLDAGDPDDVGGARQVDAVAGADRRHDDAELERDLAAQAAHAGQQVLVGSAADEVDEVGREQDLERVHAHLLDQLLRAVVRRRGGAGLRAGLHGGLLLDLRAAGAAGRRSAASHRRGRTGASACPGGAPRAIAPTPAIRSAVRDWPSCLPAAVPRSPSAVARVTTMPVDTDSSSAGIWVTRPSPMVSRL